MIVNYIILFSMLHYQFLKSNGFLKPNSCRNDQICHQFFYNYTDL